MTKAGRHGNADVWIGIDIGTQSVRASAVSSHGESVGKGSQSLTSQREPPRHEQDPEEWWKAAAGACRKATEAIAPERIRGVAVDGTSGTILLSDRSGRPLTPGLMYDDGRAGAEAKRVNEIGAEVWRSLGYRMQPSWGLPKLLWLVRNEPGLLKSARLLHQTDFLCWRLAGKETASDSSNALKTGFNLINERWPDHVMEQLGIPLDILPEVARPGTRIGVVCKQAAGETGIPEGTPLIAGMTDGCAAQMGAGAVRVGSWNSVLGTTLVLKGVTSELVRDPNGVVYSHRSPDGNWLPGGASSTGAGILSKDYVGKDLAALDREASRYEPASIVTYPLASRGERFPFSVPAAEGFTIGETNDEADRYAAVLQGVAYIERLCFDYLDYIGASVDGELSFTGGAAKSAYWCQLRADVLQRPARLPEEAEAALGMCVLAASAESSLGESARRMVRMKGTVEPSIGKKDQLTDGYLRLMKELAAREWIGKDVLQHVEERAGQ